MPYIEDDEPLPPGQAQLPYRKHVIGYARQAGGRWIYFCPDCAPDDAKGTRRNGWSEIIDREDDRGPDPKRLAAEAECLSCGRNIEADLDDRYVPVDADRTYCWAMRL